MSSKNTRGNNKSVQPSFGNSNLEKLSALLRSEGHRALNGGSCLTLTTKVLEQINRECRRHSVSGDDEAATEVGQGDRSNIRLTNKHRNNKQDFNKARTEWNDHIHFIKDFMQFTPNLKLIGCTGTLTTKISLHRFGNLTSLNLQKVPVHLIEGLQPLRSTLASITVYKCVDRVKDVLQHCGGDLCALETWPQLKFVSFTYNSISQLDDSLRMIPYVEVLDLNHNHLQTCDSFLEYLNDVRCLSLAYNFLSDIPPISASTRASLTSLALRGNNLDNLTEQADVTGNGRVDRPSSDVDNVGNGRTVKRADILNVIRKTIRVSHSSQECESATLTRQQENRDKQTQEVRQQHRPGAGSLEELRALHYLDLGENYISAHSVLDPLSALVCLHQLQLDGNPVFYHRLHRQLTAACLSRQSANVQFELDKRKLTASEIAYFSHVRAQFGTMVASKLPQRGRVSGRRRSLERGFENSISSFSGNETKSDSADKTSPRPHRKNRHKRLKPRRTPIADRDMSGHVYYSQDVRPGSAPPARSLEQQWRDRSEEAMKTKHEIEDLRKHYGPHWLLAIEDKAIFNKQKTVSIVLSPGTSETGQEKTGTGSRNRVKDTMGASDIHGVKDRADMNPSEDLKTDVHERLPDVSGLCTQEATRIDSKKPVMSTIARLAAGVPSDRTGEESESTLGNVSNLKLDESQPQHLHNPASRPTNSPVNADSDVAELESTVSDAKWCSSESVLEISRGICDSTNTLKVNSDMCIIAEPSSDLVSVTVLPEVKVEQAFSSQNTDTEKQPPPTIKSGTDLQGFSSLGIDGRSVELDRRPQDVTTSEEDEVTEPMFVTCPLKHNEILILCMTAMFLLEKDIRGTVIEKLELSSLRMLEWKKVRTDTRHEDGDHTSHLDVTGVSGRRLEDGERSVLMEDKKETSKSGVENESIQLDLKFDYVRKDKQSRRYLLEVADGNVIIAHLQPILDSREGQASESSRSLMQCLKCSQTCQKQDLLQQRKMPSKSQTSTGELTDKDTQICPKCGSNLVIELMSACVDVKSASNADRPAPPETTKLPSRRRIGGLTRRFIRSVKKDVDDGKGDHSKVSTSLPGRDRSSAFRAPPNMNRSTLLSQHQPVESSGDELDCVKDYFSVDATSDVTTSSQLAKMISRLRGDSSSRGSKSAAGMAPVSVHHRSELVETVKDISHRPEGIILNVVDNPTMPISIHNNAKRRSSTTDKRKDEETENKEKACSVYGLKSALSSLAVMNDIVNTLVTEGNCLEEQAKCNTRTHLRSTDRRVSLSDISQSSHDQIRTPGLGSLDRSDARTTFKLSESYTTSSAFPTQSARATSDTVQPPLMHNSSENNLTVSEGNPAENNMFKAESNLSRTIAMSPHTASLNSHMSYRLETTVNVPQVENCSSSGVDSNDTDVDECSATASLSSQSRRHSEDVLSIYDYTNEPTSLSNRTLFSGHTLTHSAGSVPPSKSPRDKRTAVSHVTASTVPGTYPREHSETVPLTNAGEVAMAAVSSGEDEDEMSDEDNDLVPNYAFHHLNHRLTLHMMMSLFGADEEFVCKIQCLIVQYIIEEPYNGILVMSSHRFYVFKIISENHSQSPDLWVQCVEIQPIPELRYIDVGLGGQSLRLEFVTDCSSFTCITQNLDKTAQFVEVLHDNLVKFSVRHGITSHVVVTEDVDQTTLNNLDQDVVSEVKTGQKLLFYCIGFVERGTQERMLASFAVTSCDICLVNTNHQWPQPRLQAPITMETVGKQFTVLERQKITNVASLEVCEVTLKKIRLQLFSDSGGVSKCWKITLATRQTAVDFITALADPWSREFGVELDITYTELDF